MSSEDHVRNISIPYPYSRLLRILLTTPTRAGYVKITEQLGIGMGAPAVDSMTETAAPKGAVGSINAAVKEGWDAFSSGG